jgi:hypothetical protein
MYNVTISDCIASSTYRESDLLNVKARVCWQITLAEFAN